MTVTCTDKTITLVDLDGDKLIARRFPCGDFTVETTDVVAEMSGSDARMFAAHLFRLAVGAEHVESQPAPMSSPLCRAIDALRTAADELEQLPVEVRRPAQLLAGHGWVITGMRSEADHLEQLVDLVTNLNSNHERHT